MTWRSWLESPRIGGRRGVSQVSLAPQIGMGGELGQIDDDIAPGGQFQFVYAITTDRTIRVADVLDVKKECDTQVDSRYLRSITDVRRLSCLPVGDPTTPPRRAGVRGPGIQLVGDVLPMSVDIIKSAAIEGDGRNPEDPGRLVGYFAVIGASNGGVFIVNVDDDRLRDSLRQIHERCHTVVGLRAHDAPRRTLVDLGVKGLAIRAELARRNEPTDVDGCRWCSHERSVT